MNEKISDQDFVIPPIPPKLEKKAEVLPKDTTFGGITEIVKMLKDSEELPPKLRAEINLKLLDFVYPRLKAVSMEINETSGDIVKETLNEMNRKSVGFDFIKRNKTTFVEEE